MPTADKPAMNNFTEAAAESSSALSPTRNRYQLPAATRIYRPKSPAAMFNEKCSGCGRTFRSYRVFDALWSNEIQHEGNLCLRCAERRLGRQFVPADFVPKLPVNAWVESSFARGVYPAKEQTPKTVEPKAITVAAKVLIPKDDPMYTTYEAAKKYADAAISKNTKRAYAADWRDFVSWCYARKRSPLPAESETIRLYFADLAEHQLAPSTITRRASTISLAHQYEGYPSPCDKTQHRVRAVLKGIRRTKGMKQKAKEPLNLELYRKILNSTTHNPLLAARNRALFAFGLSGAFRRSELVSIKVEDLVRHKQGITVHLGKSKTDQEGVGREVEIPIGVQPEGTPLHELTCPVRLLDQWLRQSAIKTGPVFRNVSALGEIGEALSANSVAKILKAALELAGLTDEEIAKYAAHSLRAGFVTAAYNNGAQEVWIMRQTGHKSIKMLNKYIRADKDARQKAAATLGI